MLGLPLAHQLSALEGGGERSVQLWGAHVNSQGKTLLPVQLTVGSLTCCSKVIGCLIVG